MSKHVVLLIGICLGWAAAAEAQNRPAAAANPAPAVLDPVVRDLLATNPTTPSQILNVLETIVDLGQAKAGQGLLARLAAMQLSDEQLADLDREFGSGVFLKLSLAADLQPAGKQFADRVLAAARKHARDPAHLAQLIGRLTSPSVNDRAEAIAELARGGDAAVAALVQTLAEAASAEQRKAASDALMTMGELSIGALAATLAGDRHDLSARAAALLGVIGTAQARLWLLAPALGRNQPNSVQTAAERALVAISGKLPTTGEAAAELYNAAIQYDQHPPALPEGPGGLVTLWSWDTKTQLPVAEQLPARLATRELAARLAAGGRSILPDEAQLRRLHDTLSLEAAIARAGGLGQLNRQPGGAWERIAAEGLPAVEDLLEYAAGHGHPLPAVVAAEILGARGSEQLLVADNGRARPLAKAAAHPDRRLRFAAVGAIIAIDPKDPYPGSSLVADALQYFMGSHGERVAVVGSVQAADAQEVGGWLAAFGYRVLASAGNREAVRQAIAAPDLELVLLDLRMASELGGKVVQDLRRDCRTADVPIGLLAAIGNVASIDEDLIRLNMQETQNLLARRKAEVQKQREGNYVPSQMALGDPADLERRLASLETALLPLAGGRMKVQALALSQGETIARQQPRTATMLRPLNTLMAQAMVTRLALLAPDLLPAEVRLAQARQALGWLASRAPSARSELYPLVHFESELVSAARVPALVDAALPLLADLGTPACQRALVDLASTQGLALGLRQAAATAFGRNVTQHGILLTSAQIARQYDRYNASEQQDRQTQAVLATILDSMEEHAARQASRPGVR